MKLAMPDLPCATVNPLTWLLSIGKEYPDILSRSERSQMRTMVLCELTSQRMAVYTQNRYDRLL